MVKLANGKTKLEKDYKDPAKYAASRKSKSSQKMYAVALKAFAEHVNKRRMEEDKKNPKKSRKKPKPISYETLHTYLEHPQLEDITSFAVDKAAGTRKGYVSVVRSWLKHNEVELSESDLEEIRVTVKKDDMTRNEPLTIDIIRDMCDHSKIQGKALFLTLLSSGCRIEELLLTELKDVDLEKGTIFIRGDITKTKNSRTVIISLESIKYLREWIAERDAYIISSEKRGQFKRGEILRGVKGREREIKREDLLFPYSYETARSLFATAIRKVFKIKAAPDPKHPKANLRRNWGDLYDPNTKRSVIHIHSFRGTFRMQLRKGVDSEICEILMGHMVMGGAYRDITTDQLIAEYRKGEEHITVYPPTDELRQKIKTLADKDAMRDAENKRLRERIEQMEKDHKLLLAQLDKQNILPIATHWQIKDRKTGEIVAEAHDEFKIE